MPRPKGVTGDADPRYNPSATRRGYRPPPIDISMEPLLKAICKARGGSIAEHITKALIRYASVEEADAAGLVE